MISGKDRIMFKCSRFRIIIMIVGCLVILLGCSMNSKPLFLRYDAEGKPIMQKRYRRYIVRDFKTRFRKEAYKKNNTTGPHFLLSRDQVEVKEKYGPPEYIGISYLSLRKDHVKEWLYLKKGLMFQFVNRKLAYEGPLSDKERVLVLYGYPDDAYSTQAGEQEFIRENFYYYTLFGTSSKSFCFINGKCLDQVIVQ